MSDYKEYIVTTADLATTDSVWDDLLSSGPTPETIPDRVVEVANERPLNGRNTSYYLTDAEAFFLNQDPRVEAVQDVTNFKIHKKAFQVATFSKDTEQTGPKANWGLLRHINITNIYGSSTADPGGTYDYVLDGTNVDVVIIDSGIQADHPEFTSLDNPAVSRVNTIDWYAESGVAGTMPTGFYADYDGHGTHVAGIVAGKTFGWAKNAQIFSIKLDGLRGPSDTGEGFDATTAFDVLLGWHNNKTNGHPTVVINSWSYGIIYRSDLEVFAFSEDEFATLYNINGGSYRGTPWTGSTLDVAKGHTGQQVSEFGYLYPFRVPSVDADIAQLVEAGVIVCNAAGNESIKVDSLGGFDYNNYISTDFGTFFYHRGSSPSSQNIDAFYVGAVSSLTQGIIDRKAGYSNSGPGVNIYAAGSQVMSSMSQTNVNNSSYPYFLNTGYKQELLSGTSMANPQIAGMAALVLQMHPDWSPNQVVDYMINQSLPNLYSTGEDDDYASSTSLLGGASRLAYVPTSAQRVFTIFSS
jgi:subtilisin family serine protease